MFLKMGHRMKKILLFMNQKDSDCTTVKSIILGVENLESLPERKRTKVLYSTFSSSLNKLVHQGFIRKVVSPYHLTERGRNYLRKKD